MPQSRGILVSFSYVFFFSLSFPLPWLFVLVPTLASTFLLFIGSLGSLISKERMKEGRSKRKRKMHMCAQVIEQSLISLYVLTSILISHLINSIFHSVDIYANSMVSNKRMFWVNAHK